MSRPSRFQTVALAAALGALAARAAFGQNVGKTLATLDPPGSIDTRPFGISPTGDIVGLYITNDGRTHGFLLSGNVYSTIDVPDSTRTNAIAVNVLGDIVGRYDTKDGKAHGYVLSDGVVTTIDAPGSSGFTVVTDINPARHVVGRYRGTDGRFHGFSLIDGTFTTIDHPDGIGIQAMAIDPEDVIAGYYVDHASQFHAFLLDQDVFTTIDPPGSVGTGTAAGVVKINPAGTLVGCYKTAPDGSQHGFIDRNGAFTSFDFPNAISTMNFGINPQGDIVGLYVDREGRNHGFLAPKGTEEGK